MGANLDDLEEAWQVIGRQIGDLTADVLLLHNGSRDESDE